MTRAEIRKTMGSLSPADVRPGGWLRDWSRQAAAGITGHLDELHTVFGDSWKGFGLDAAGAEPDGTGWPLEQGAYWLDGAVRLAYALGDDVLLAKVRARLDPIVDAVLEGGESFVHWVPSEQVYGHYFTSWAHSHLGRALVAYYRGSEDQRVLEALRSAYRAYRLDELSGYDILWGSANVDAMLDTAELADDERIVAELIRFARDAEYRDAVEEWLGSEPNVAQHAVVFNEAVRIPAMLSTVTGRRSDLAATTEAIAWSDRLFGLPLGLSSGEEYFSGIGATRNVETCDVPATMWTFLRLLEITGDAVWADRIERIFFNAGPGCVSHDFESMSYYQSPNRYGDALPSEEPQNPGPGGYAYAPTGPWVLCCVGNLNRIVPFYVGHMWMRTDDGGLAATLFGPGEVTADVHGVSVTISTRTAYPFEETVRFELTTDAPVGFPLHVRIPGWCSRWRLAVNGVPALSTVSAHGFAVVDRVWSPGDVVELIVAMDVTVESGRETSFPAIEYFEVGPQPWLPNRSLASIGGIDSPFTCVTYGPLLMVLPLDGEEGRALDGEFFALSSSGADIDAEVIRDAAPPTWTWAARILHVVVTAGRFTWAPSENEPIPATAVTAVTPARVELVPYGTTKHRIAMFAALEGSPTY